MTVESYKFLHQINKIFTDIVFAEGGMEEIAQSLSDFCRAKIQILNTSEEILFEVSAQGDAYKKNGNGSSIKREVGINGEVITYIKLIRDHGPIQDTDRLALESAAQNIGFIHLKGQIVEEVDKQYRHEFLNDLMDGNIVTKEEIIQQGTYYELDFSKPYIAMVMNMGSLDALFPKREKREYYKLLKKTFDVVLKTFFTASNNNVIIWNRKNSIVILYPLPNEYLKVQEAAHSDIQDFSVRVATDIKRAVENNLEQISITVGLGRYYADIAHISKSYRESVDALRTGKAAWGENKIYHYDDLGIYKLFVKYHDKKELNLFVSDMIGPLIDYDAKNNTSFLKTMEQLLDNYGKQKLTAEKLFIHPKTLAYRKRKIEYILSISLDDASDILSVHTAVKVKRVLEPLQ